jgi:hypothetical protein
VFLARGGLGLHPVTNKAQTGRKIQDALPRVGIIDCHSVLKGFEKPKEGGAAVMIVTNG